MIVTAQYRGNRASGLLVGAENARRYFSRRIQSIELQLDHLRIVCGLTPDFWRDRPEIRDPRLCLWLETKHAQSAPIRTEITMAMIPTGKDSFKLTAFGEKSEIEFEIGKRDIHANRDHLPAIASA